MDSLFNDFFFNFGIRNLNKEYEIPGYTPYESTAFAPMHDMIPICAPRHNQECTSAVSAKSYGESLSVMRKLLRISPNLHMTPVVITRLSRATCTLSFNSLAESMLANSLSNVTFHK